MGKANLHVFFLLFLILSSFCESNDQLTQANSLSPGDMLISEGRVFALGFFSPTNSNQSLYLGIWYHSIPERTVVWVANRDSPISNHSSVKLTISNSSEMVLFDSEGRAVWMTASTTIAGGAEGALAVLLDSGNFVLRLLNGTVVWQSIDHLTDTILPNTRVLLSYKAQVVGRLVAWKGPDDPSSGDFSFSIDPSSNLQIFIWNGSLPYKRLDVVNEVSVSGGTYQSNTTSVMSQYLYYRGDELYYTYTVSDGSPYTRILLDNRGNLSLLSWNNTSLSWTLASNTPSYCFLYASCGPFGYCDVAAVPTTCRCPDGFELVDSLDLSRGCQRKEALRCGKKSNFMTMPNMKVPDKFLHIRNTSFDQCADECSRNCSCMAYAYANLSSAGGTMGDTSRCLVWTGDLIDMEKASFFHENLYIRLAESPVQKKNSFLKMLLPIIACVLLVTFGTLVWTCKSRGNRQKKKVQKRTMLDYLSSMDEAGGKNIEFPLISFEKIVAATDNFSNCNMLGQGGFGKVYKGMLEGTKEVAVKRLSKGSGQGTEEFRNEVVLIAKLQHKNLVKLIGCCIHEDEKLLVYEYLPNKSLDYFLFDAARKSVLQWPTRFKVIQGVARGIMYLHQDSRLTIIHRDLKASNILLDKEMSPKISDFGMARIFCGDQLQANTNRVVGTYGYMSPEYAMEGAFSVKSDTYSFGVLMLEIVSGLKISSPYLIKDFPNLIVYVSTENAQNSELQLSTGKK
ncbi:hypothetical protein PVAP13_8KG314224 [Panicum virgatum]|uniref:Receptor-like serine/threonine-protein kinase n=1 Tax=Panicum virgatum TaxID=38727 RepID=A0A8T0PLX7_PANVG|nr:hypothetical protein PVAP13_8KG314224 [Panicum virgatum]